MQDLSQYYTVLPLDDSSIDIQDQFTNPFSSQPSPLALVAAHDLMDRLSKHDLGHDFGIDGHSGLGKMFGVLVGRNQEGQIGYLSAFSGKLDSGTVLPGFVPPVFDTQEEGGFYKQEETLINNLNRDIEKILLHPDYIKLQSSISQTQERAMVELRELKNRHNSAKLIRKKTREACLTDGDHPDHSQVLVSLDRESARHHFEFKDFARQWKKQLADLEKQWSDWQEKINLLKEKRRLLSSKLQGELFRKYTFLNDLGQEKSLHEIFTVSDSITPPSGAGECAAPKLLQFAFQYRIKPVAIAEFWWGRSPDSEIRRHAHFYPACRSKCFPILQHMMLGLQVKTLSDEQKPDLGKEIKILFEDECIVVLEKPTQFLSVPGKEIKDSVMSRLRARYPNASGPLLVHRLDMSTSGVMIAAKSKEIHAILQKQFENRTIKKRYVAILQGIPSQAGGKIDLPLRVDLEDRPRQLVCYEHGKRAETYWKMKGSKNGHARIHFFPVSGRTHQLRVHAAHPDGLGLPILGDDLYGIKNDRLYLHAEQITFKHPVRDMVMTVTSPCPF